MLPNDQPARNFAITPANSCLVQAPAGSGKTTLLAMRYLALLEVVAHPEEILAITFTIKAAAEMRARVLDLLAQDEPLAQRVRERAERLNWRITENPNTLKIQTIDSFALEIARRAPGPSNVSGYDIVEDPATCYVGAAEALLLRVIDDDPTASLIADFLAFLDNDPQSFIRLISAMLAKRDQWLALAQSVSQADAQAELVDALTATVADMRAQAEAELRTVLSDDDLYWLTRLTAPAEQWTQGLSALLTKSGSLRKVIPTALLPDKAERKIARSWLESLYERGLSHPLEHFGTLPQVDDLPANSNMLHNCCICLALAALELEQRFRQDGLTDFTGLLLNAKLALKDPEGNATDLALLLDYRIDHILIDEFQDTSRGQFELFELLIDGWQADEQKSFFAVGDPMQSIYRFRDADVSIFNEVKQTGIGAIRLHPCYLTANFRSDPRLVEWVNKLFHDNPDLKTQPMTATHADPMVADQPDANVRCSRFTRLDDELNACLAHLQDVLQRDESSSVAILCRSRTHLIPLLRQLAARNISWQATDIDLLKDAPVVSDLMSALTLLLDPSQRLAWFALLRSPLFGASLNELLAIGDADFATYLERQAPAYVDRLRAAYRWGQQHLYELSLREALEGFWLRCGGADAYQTSDLENAAVFFELLDTLQPEQQTLADITAAVERLFAQSPHQSRVNVLTMHKAKGLEFDHVIVPRLDAGTGSDEASLLLWQVTRSGLLLGLKGDQAHSWLQAQNRVQARQEELRLLYVASTRARRTLFLSYCQAEQARPGGLANYLMDVAQTEPDTELNQPALPLQQELFNTRPLQRLPVEYRWAPPAVSPLPYEPQPGVTTDPIAHRLEVEVGNLVHQALAYLAQRSMTTIPDAELTRLFELWAPTADVEALATAGAQVQKLLHSELGQWVLAAHPQHECEAGYQMADAGELLSIVVDRMFVCDDQRWIIDYKTSQLDSAPVSALIARYRPQLQRYARVISSYYPEPVRTAILFTDRIQLEVVD